MREKILYIVCMAFTALLFSCSKDAMDDELLPVTRAQLSIGLEDKSEVERQEEIKSIRFIVFSNASGDVKLNVNKLVTLDTPATDEYAQVSVVAAVQVCVSKSPSTAFVITFP